MLHRLLPILRRRVAPDTFISRADGGAVHTARTALREGRAVFAVKWEEGELGGNGQLLGEGAGALRPEDDVCAASRRGDPAGRPGPFETG